MKRLKVLLVTVVLPLFVFSITAQSQANEATEVYEGTDPKQLLEIIEAHSAAIAQWHELLTKQKKLDERLHQNISSVDPKELSDVYNAIDPLIPKLARQHRGRALVFKGYIASWIHLRSISHLRLFDVTAPPDPIIEEGLKHAVRGKKLLEMYSKEDLPWAEAVIKDLEEWHE